MQTVLNLLEVEPIRLLLSFGAVLFLVLNLAAILTMAERKVSGYIQLRFGPNRVGPRGLLQPAADVFKLFSKENVSPGRSDLWVFLGAPIAMFIPAALVWLVVPFAPDAVVADLNVAILFFVAITSIGAFGVLAARRLARGSADDLLRGPPDPEPPRRRDALRKPLTHRRSKGAGRHHLDLVLFAPAPDVPDVLHLRYSGGEAGAFRPPRG